MNAYALLGIEDLINRDPDAEEGQFIDGILKIRTKQKLNDGIREINKILQEQLGIIKKLEKVEEKLNELIEYNIAYDLVATAEDRRDYAKKGKPDIKQMAENVKKTLTNAVALESNGKISNAYQILGVANDVRTHETFEEKDKQDKYIERKTYESVSLAMSTPKLTDIPAIKAFLLNLTKYYWAYSKISSDEKRTQYKYEELAKQGDKAARSLGEARLGVLKNQELCPIDVLNNSECDRIDISKVAVMQSRAFGVQEQYAYGYRVDKHRADETIESSQIFSNIDMVRIKNDVIYRERVVQNLLSNKAIRLGQENLGGYVGEIDENGSVKFDLETIGACRAWERRRCRAQNQNKQGQEKHEESTTLKQTAPNQDLDSDDRR